MKIRLIGVELFHVDRRRDITKQKKSSGKANLNKIRTKGRQPDRSMKGEIKERFW